MKKLILTASILGLLIIAFFVLPEFARRSQNHPESLAPESVVKEDREEEKSEKPSDWFVRQRAYPEQTINIAAYRNAMEQAKRIRSAAPQSDEVVWEEAGPNNIGGRITAIGAHPTTPQIVYAGAADGGVLKSTNYGTTWTPVFDETGALSIGAIAVDPNNPNVLWVGTGEANAAGDNYPGNGIYRSNDAGITWIHMGLENSYHIGRIAVDPTNSQRIFVAVSGALFGTNPERGVYRTENGGMNWQRVLYLTDSTAAIDVVINPQNPQIVYAAMWERIRHPDQRSVGGVTSGIWRSTNGGDNWMLLTNGLPPSAPDIGRIGITICPSNPDILYAIYADHPGYLMGVWKTTNGGDSWTQTGSPSSSLYSSFGWYFGNIYVDPVNPDKIFALGVPLQRSTNGGASWSNVSGNMHVDHHALWINPNDPNFIYDGNDGGAYYSTNGGTVWNKCYDLHISQFYAIEIDFLNPYRLYGGTQDNGTLRTWTGNLNDWEMIYGGDGFYSIVDYTNSNTIFAEYQYGGLGKSTNGGNSFSSALTGISSSDRRNWSTPVVMDPVDHNVMYYGTYRIYKSTNLAGNWTAISPDLTDGPPTGNLTYHTVTTIAVAPTNTQVIYTGTDDGNVWVTQNGGNNWTRIDDAVPDRWVTRVAVSPQNAATAYTTLSGYRINEYLPHVFRTENYGTDWTDISGNLPEAPVNVILEDPVNPQRLFIGSDMGVYFTEDLGISWLPLGLDLPICSIADLKLHNPTRILVAGTHGRSMYKTSLDSLAAFPDITLSLTPENPPIQIPASGGSFNFNIAATNNEPTTQSITVWCDVTLPNGTPYGPVLGPATITMSAGTTIDRDRTQSVPASAPAGLYQYNAYVGVYPDAIWDSDSFPFTKLISGDEGEAVTQWLNSGESLTNAEVIPTANKPMEFPLLNAYPNPFNLQTSIRFSLPEDGSITLSIFDINGRRIATLVNEWKPAGDYDISWNATELTSGIYFAHLETATLSSVKKLILLK